MGKEGDLIAPNIPLCWDLEWFFTAVKSGAFASSEDRYIIEQGSSTLDLEIHFPAEISSNLD